MELPIIPVITVSYAVQFSFPHRFTKNYYTHLHNGWTKAYSHPSVVHGQQS